MASLVPSVKHVRKVGERDSRDERIQVCGITEIQASRAEVPMDCERTSGFIADADGPLLDRGSRSKSLNELALAFLQELIERGGLHEVAPRDWTRSGQAWVWYSVERDRDDEYQCQ